MRDQRLLLNGCSHRDSESAMRAGSGCQSRCWRRSASHGTVGPLPPTKSAALGGDLTWPGPPCWPGGCPDGTRIWWPPPARRRGDSEGARRLGGGAAAPALCGRRPAGQSVARAAAAVARPSHESNHDGDRPSRCARCTGSPRRRRGPGAACRPNHGKDSGDPGPSAATGKIPGIPGRRTRTAAESGSTWRLLRRRRPGPRPQRLRPQ
jgi:hypothetical protein